MSTIVITKKDLERIEKAINETIISEFKELNKDLFKELNKDFKNYMYGLLYMNNNKYKMTFDNFVEILNYSQLRLSEITYIMHECMLYYIWEFASCFPISSKMYNELFYSNVQSSDIFYKRIELYESRMKSTLTNHIRADECLDYPVYNCDIANEIMNEEITETLNNLQKERMIYLWEVFQLVIKIMRKYSRYIKGIEKELKNDLKTFMKFV